METYEGKTTRLGPRCQHCQGAMSEGFMMYRDENGITQQAEWAEGEPRKRSAWLGGGIDMRGVRRYSVRIYRCEACGYLASYATEPLNDV